MATSPAGTTLQNSRPWPGFGEILQYAASLHASGTCLRQQFCPATSPDGRGMGREFQILKLRMSRCFDCGRKCQDAHPRPCSACPNPWRSSDAANEAGRPTFVPRMRRDAQEPGTRATNRRLQRLRFSKNLPEFAPLNTPQAHPVLNTRASTQKT